MHKFKELKVWQKARILVKEVYLITRKFPSEETYGIISQIRRSAVSIPANIAEGCGRNSDNEFNRFLDIANGSAFELETLFTLSCDLEYVTDQEFQKKLIMNFKRFRR